MLCLIGLVILFHLSIVFKIVPYDIAWGGNLKSDQEMYVFEAISILINLLLGGILLIKGGFVKQLISSKIVNVVLWVFFGLFVLNTVGNVLAKTNFEKYFAILTLLFAVLIWVILKKDKK